MTPEQFQAFIVEMGRMFQASIPTAATATAATAATSAGRDGGRLVAKFFQCQQFSGKPEHWSDFACRFKRAARSQSNEVYEMLIESETSEESFDPVDRAARGPVRGYEDANP